MQEKDNTRRKVLIGLTTAVSLSGIPFAATPFIASWNPSARAKAAGASVKVDVSKMQYGQQIQVAWRTPQMSTNSSNNSVFTAFRSC